MGGTNAPSDTRPRPSWIWIPEIPDVTQRIREICALVESDGILFDLAGIEGSRIKEDAEYEGVRLRVPASLDGARIVMQIDVGFGDLVDPAPGPLTFPVLLPLAAPVLRAYPPEAVIAEKFHAMVVLGIANSRMKDFFDIWTLGQTHHFEIGQLARAIGSTFERRQTPVPEDLPLALTGEFLEDPAKLTQWTAFGKRLALGDLPKLPAVGGYIAAFLKPALDAQRHEGAAGREWIPGGPWS